MDSLKALLASLKREAQREPFPIDTSAYEKAGREVDEPVLYAGLLDAPICVFGRDLGKDEVAAGQPLIGAGGRLVRAGLFRHHFSEEPQKSDKTLERVLKFALLTNTVPYKPPGNKAYNEAVKERFRPYVLKLLTRFWSGNHLITLGNEAFFWFAPYGGEEDAKRFWTREDRYEATWKCTLREGDREKAVVLLPLPHPSPLNARWYKQFPALLAARLHNCS